jgi:hypothetical protein
MPEVQATAIERQLMNAVPSRASKVQLLEETRCRSAEFYFNGLCLVRAVLRGRFSKIPFFLRHLWCALAGED